jgi:arylsulfatase A-like enzyme
MIALSLITDTTAAATQPNIVVIMTDDQTLESIRVMPKTRELIGGPGTTFSNSFVSNPLCCPSRATFLTGQHQHNHGVLNNEPPAGGYTKLNHGNTLPLWLQEAGYFTAHIGKYLNGYGELTPQTLVPPGWSDWQGLVDRSTYLMYNYTINDNGTLVTYGETAADYQTDVIAARAEETINEAVLTDKPFFLSIAPLAPHVEAIQGTPDPRPAPRHLGAFDSEPLPRPPSFNEADVSDKPAVIRNLPVRTSSAIQTITNQYRSRLASLLAVDDLVERVVNALSSAGVLSNTVVIFTSDNGFFHGEHRIQANKKYVYEEAIRVPLFIRGGGFPSGVTRNQFVSNVDLAPTIVGLTGATARRVMDGRSLLPLALDPTVAPARDLLIDTLTYRAVRTRDYVYAEHDNGEKELYDMRPSSPHYDPYQIQSRHADTTYGQIRSDLAVKLASLRNCSGASCNPEPAPTTCQDITATQTGTTGNDTINGTPGVDVIAGLGGNDIINGLGGDDRICGDAGMDKIRGGIGNDAFNGGAGVDTADYTNSATTVTVDLSTGSATGEGSDTMSVVENITGSRFVDTLTGDGLVNVLNGLAGNDKLNGAAGNDTLNGADGNDAMNGGTGTDTCNGGAGSGDTRTACETVTGVP